eukprot:15339411-Ditylum_brightwellii.AAC.1
MMCANFKPLEASMEELGEYLKGVECSEIKNPPDSNPRKKNSDGPKQTEKNKRKRNKDRESHDITANTMSSKKSHRNCKLYKILLDGHKKKHMDKAKKEDFCAMAKAVKKANLKSKKSCKRSAPNLLEFESSLDEE